MMYKCFNPFMLGKRMIKYDEIVSQEVYEKVPPRNQKWFIAIPDSEEPKKVDPEIIP